MSDELLPSEVRVRVLEDHAALREKMTELRELLAGGRHEETLEASRAFVAQLSAHLDLEDEILLPTLETIDAWGPERRKRLAAEHAQQRLAIAAVADAIAGTPGPETVEAQMTRLLDDLVIDMRHEETENLSPDLLTELPIRVGMID